MRKPADRKGGIVDRIFGRMPKHTAQQVERALEATAAVRQNVRPTLDRARQVADDYSELDRILKRG